MHRRVTHSSSGIAIGLVSKNNHKHGRRERYCKIPAKIAFAIEDTTSVFPGFETPFYRYVENSSFGNLLHAIKYSKTHPSDLIWKERKYAGPSSLPRNVSTTAMLPKNRFINKLIHPLSLFSTSTLPIQTARSHRVTFEDDDSSDFEKAQTGHELSPLLTNCSFPESTSSQTAPSQSFTISIGLMPQIVSHIIPRRVSAVVKPSLEIGNLIMHSYISHVETSPFHMTDFHHKADRPFDQSPIME